MPVLVLTFAKIIFMVVLWIFLLLALRTVTREIRLSASQSDAAPDLLRRKAELRVVQPKERKGTRVTLTHGMTIGRDPQSGLHLPDDYVSGTHARIVARGDDFFVEDAGSRNGTYVNHKRINTPALIRRGDSVQIGRTVLEVMK